MALAINPAATKEFVLAAEVGKEDATVFILGTIPAWEMMPLFERIQNLPRVTEGEAENFYTCFAPVMRDLLRAGLRGWRNFRIGDGSDAPFKTGAEGRASDAVLSYLDPGTASELAWAVLNFNTLGASQKGN